MCRALELRTPLVDHILLEAVVSAGRWARGRRQTYKQTLFGAMPDLGVRGSVSRRKRGFVLPYDAWLREALTNPSAAHFRDAALRLRQPRYAPYVARFLDRRLHWSKIWALYLLDRISP